MMRREEPEYLMAVEPRMNAGRQAGAPDLYPAAALASWDGIVERLGLAPDPRFGTAWSTTRDGATLVVEVEPVDESSVRLSAWAGCPDSLMMLRRAHALDSGGRLETGDSDFDDAVLVVDADATVLGTLDARTREALTVFVTSGGVAARGALRLSAAVMVAFGRRIEPLLPLVLQLAARLNVARAERLTGIVDIAANDPDARVRAAYRARFARDAEVRAAATGTHEVDARRALVARVVDPWASLEARAEALARLLEPSTLAEVAPLLARLPVDLVPHAASIIEATVVSGGAAPEVGLLCVAHLDHHVATSSEQRVRLFTALGRTRHPGLATWLAAACGAADNAVFEAALGALLRIAPLPGDALAHVPDDALTRVLQEAPDLIVKDATRSAELLVPLFATIDRRSFGLRRRYLEAFGAAGDPRHADLVASELDSADDATRAEATRALGAIGGPAHVTLLTKLTEGFFRAGAEKERARLAIAAIHARLGSHLRGGMALAESDVRGGLSSLDE